MPSPSELTARAWAALGDVIDPCSLVNGTHLSLVDLGMIHCVEVTDDGRVRIDLLLDDPLCLYMGAIHAEIRDRVAPAVGGASIDITIKGDVIWTLDLATETTRQRVAGWQHQRRERAGNRPVLLPTPVRRDAVPATP